MTDTNDPVEVLILHSFHGLQRGPDTMYCNAILIQPATRWASGSPREGFMKGFIPTGKGGLRQTFLRTLTDPQTLIEYTPATSDSLLGELQVGDDRYKVSAEFSGSAGIVFERKTFPREGAELTDYICKVTHYLTF